MPDKDDDDPKLEIELARLKINAAKQSRAARVDSQRQSKSLQDPSSMSDQDAFSSPAIKYMKLNLNLPSVEAVQNDDDDQEEVLVMSSSMLRVKNRSVSSSSPEKSMLTVLFPSPPLGCRQSALN